MEATRLGRFLFPSLSAACEFLKELKNDEASGAANMVGARIDENLTGMLHNGGTVVQTLTHEAYELAKRFATPFLE